MNPPVNQRPPHCTVSTVSLLSGKRGNEKKKGKMGENDDCGRGGWGHVHMLQEPRALAVGALWTGPSLRTVLGKNAASSRISRATEPSTLSRHSRPGLSSRETFVKVQFGQRTRGERKPKPHNHNFSARNDCASQKMWVKITHIFCTGPQQSRVNLQVWRSARKKMRKLQSSQSYKVHMNRAAFLPASGGGGGGHAHGMALAPVLLGR